jgi:hypothetical protein
MICIIEGRYRKEVGFCGADGLLVAGGGYGPSADPLIWNTIDPNTTIGVNNSANKIKRRRSCISLTLPYKMPKTTRWGSIPFLGELVHASGNTFPHPSTLYKKKSLLSINNTTVGV